LEKNYNLEVEVTVDIIDYLGRFGNGIIVLLNISIDDEYSEAVLFYNNDTIALTVSESVEDALGSTIEEWEGYREMLEFLFSKLVPSSELYNSLDEFDLERYLSPPKSKFIDGRIDESSIVYGTQSNL
jgi:hypothetical protein